jgi:hypothetical protein
MLKDWVVEAAAPCRLGERIMAPASIVRVKEEEWPCPKAKSGKPSDCPKLSEGHNVIRLGLWGNLTKGSEIFHASHGL